MRLILYLLTNLNLVFVMLENDFQIDNSDIRYLWSIGIRVILQATETNFKKGLRSYSGNIYSPVMISFARESPGSVIQYLQAKINLLDRGNIKLSPQAQDIICQYKQHTKDIFPAFTSSKY